MPLPPLSDYRKILIIGLRGAVFGSKTIRWSDIVIDDEKNTLVVEICDMDGKVKSRILTKEELDNGSYKYWWLPWLEDQVKILEFKNS